ncbi:hypothetical protein AB5I41_19555 [Sphingomonas sp. MMS24-JH45]
MRMTGRSRIAAVAALAMCAGLGACRDRDATGKGAAATDAASPSVLKALDDAPGSMRPRGW